MLRVYSVLYLEKIWARPDDINVCSSASTLSHISSVMEEEESETVDESTSVELPTKPTPPQQKTIHQDNISSLQQPQQQKEEPYAAGTLYTKGSGSFQEHISTDSSVATIANLDTNINNTLPSHFRSETLVTNHAAVDSTKKIEPITTNLLARSSTDREYYDDDLSSDLDQESGDGDSGIVKMDITAALKELPTPPSTPLSTKFSPKRILHRAKSCITEESVKKLGRRTSMFLEKFHSQQQQEIYCPPLPAKSSLPILSPTTPSSLKTLRRQSSKLTNKGKSLSKKLKRVMSFHQSNQQHDALLNH